MRWPYDVGVGHCRVEIAFVLNGELEKCEERIYKRQYCREVTQHISINFSFSKSPFRSRIMFQVAEGTLDKSKFEKMEYRYDG